MRYSGDRNTVSDSLFGNPYNRSAVTVRDSTLHLEDVTLSDVASSDSNDYGLLVADSVVTLTNTLFTGIGGGDTANDVAVYVQGADSVLEMHGNTFTGNIRDRVLLVPGAMMGHDTTLYAQPVFDGYELQNDFTVPSGITLTVEPGVAVKGRRYVELLVQGHLEALGTPTQPITFTSTADTGPTEWAGLAFDGGSGHLRLATVRYSGDRNTVSDDMFGSPYYRSAVTLRDSTLQLEDVALRDVASSDSNDHGLLVSNSVVTLTDTLFTGIGGGITTDDVAVYVQGADSVLEMHGNTFTGNDKDRVLLMPDAMMGHDTTLYAQPVFDGYELQDDYVVPPTVTLTVEPGVTCGAAHRCRTARPRAPGSHRHPTQTRSPLPRLPTAARTNGPAWSLMAAEAPAPGTCDMPASATGAAAPPSRWVPQGSNIAVYDVAGWRGAPGARPAGTGLPFRGWHYYGDHGLYVNNSQVASRILDHCRQLRRRDL